MAKRKRITKRRQYSEEFKAEAVQMLLDGHSAESVGSNLGLSSRSVLYRWKAKVLSESGPAATALEARVQERPRGTVLGAGEHGIDLDLHGDIAERALDRVESPSRRDRFRVHLHLAHGA